MKNLLGAVAAVALGFGLAIGGAHAQAMQGSQPMNGQPSQPSMQGNQSMNGQPSMQGHIVKRTSTQTKMAQTRLKQDGLYKGKIDGKVGPKTRRAVAEFQQRNGLRQTARLDSNTLSQLLGNQTTGFGASTPTHRMNHRMANHRNRSVTNASGSSLNNPTTGAGENAAPTTPPPGPNMNAAGGNNMPPPATPTAPGPSAPGGHTGPAPSH